MKKKEEVKEEFTLPNKTVKVVPNIKPTPFIPDTGHLASFLAPRASRTFCVPYLRNGQIKSILTNDEKEYLEGALGEDLSIYKKDNNFWLDFELELGKDTEFLDLSDPMQYIKYKLLMNLPKVIAKSEEEVQTKNSFKYYLVDLEEEQENKADKVSLEEKAWTLLAELKKDRTKMKDVLTLYGKKVSSEAKDNWMSNQLVDLFKRNPKSMKEFVDKVSDPDFDLRTLVEKAVNARALIRRNNHYFLPEGDKLASSTDQLIQYFKDPKNQETYMLVEQRTKNAEE